MMLRTSSNKLNPAVNMYRQTVRRSIGIVILVTLFLLLVCPSYVLIHINNSLATSNNGFYQIDRITQSVAVGITLVTSGVAAILCFINFSYLYSKKAGDVFHALPLTRNELLFSRFLASVVPLMIPLILCYSSLLVMTLSPKINGSIQLIIISFALNLLIMLMTAAVSLIFIVCAGNVFDLILSFLGINVGLILLVFVFADMSDAFLKGFYYGDIGKMPYYVSPFYFAVFSLTELFANFNPTSNINPVKYAVIFGAKLIGIIIVSLIITALLYNRRKAESSGRAYAFRPVYVICAVIVSMIGAYCLGAIFGDNEYKAPVFWIFAAIGSALTAVTFGAITDRGFKNSKRSLITAVCSFGLLAAATVLLYLGFFGYSSRIPSKGKIESASVGFSNNFIESDDPTLAMSIHKNIAENLDYVISSESNGEDTTDIVIRYNLINGKSFARHFTVYEEKFSDMLLEAYRSEENSETIRHNADKFAASGISIANYIFNNEDEEGIYDTEYGYSDVPISKSELKTVLEAYAEDIKKATKDSFDLDKGEHYRIEGHTEDWDYCYIEITLEDSFDKTRAAIDALGLSERVESIKESEG